MCVNVHAVIKPYECTNCPFLARNPALSLLTKYPLLTDPPIGPSAG